MSETPHIAGSDFPASTSPFGPEELAALLSISDAILGGEDLSNTLQQIVHHAAALTGADDAAMGLLKDEVLEFSFTVGHPNRRPHEVKISEGITGWVARHNRSQHIGDLSADHRFLPPAQATAGIETDGDSLRSPERQV